jgi:hypothetical protein
MTNPLLFVVGQVSGKAPLPTEQFCHVPAEPSTANVSLVLVRRNATSGSPTLVLERESAFGRPG